MRFSHKRLYVEAYVKCANCGLLLFDEGVAGAAASGDLAPGARFCSEWCREWSALRAAGVDQPRLKLPREHG